MDNPTTLTVIDKLQERFESAEGQEEGQEWEFKLAAGGLPTSVWETVSAFANSNGGWIVLGIDKDGNVEGVSNANHLITSFHNAMQTPQKIKAPVCKPEDVQVLSIDNKQVVVIRIPPASRTMRPIYINNKPYGGTYIRRGDGDHRCSEADVNRLMREASDQSLDALILKEFSLEDLDFTTLVEYRRRFQTRDSTHPFNSYDDKEFLRAIGGYRRDRNKGEEGITVAGLLVFGKPESIREWRNRHKIDYRLVAGDPKEAYEWEDRLVYDGNLFNAYNQIYRKLTTGLRTPFQLEDGIRVDETPFHIVLREGLVNLLVHADYGESDASLITQSPQGYIFRNPGSSRVPENELITENRSDPRNPYIMDMFRLIGVAEEAGSGLPRIVKTWRQLGFKTPDIISDTNRYEFQLELHAVHFLSEKDRIWLHSIGKDRQWTEAEQLALVTARNEGEV